MADHLGLLVCLGLIWVKLVLMVEAGEETKERTEVQKPLEDLKLTHCHVLCILLAKANDKESPVSKSGETDSTS